MTDALAVALADVNDPERIAQILSELDSAESPQQSGEQATLEDQYARYLSRRQDRRATTRAQYKRTIRPFIEYSADSGVIYPDELTISLVDDYVDSLFNEHDADATIHTHTKNLRAWLAWLAKRDLVNDAVYHVLDKDELGLSPNARDFALPEETAEYLLQELGDKRYGSHLYAVLATTWNGGPRVGELHALDVSDFDPGEKELTIRHRPESGTPLKNGSKDDDKPGNSERNITLHPTVVDAVSTYIQWERPTITDEYGRKPLFGTSRGRASISTLRRWLYEATSCRWLQGGPVAIACDGSCDPDDDVCQHSYYPHAIRRGAIVSHLSGGLRIDRASGRFDVSIPVLKAHYDPRSHDRKRSNREQAVRDAWSDSL